MKGRKNKKKIVVEMLLSGKSYRQIMDYFTSIGSYVSKSTISYHAKNMGKFSFEIKSVDDFDWKMIQQDYNSSSKGMVRKKYKISERLWKEAIKGGLLICSDILNLTNVTYTNLPKFLANTKNRKSIKAALLRLGVFEYKCQCCGIDSWMNNHISLQLEHKNGISDDNRLENLCLLCPNCHSQTDTYAGKNLKNPNRKVKPYYNKIK